MYLIANGGLSSLNTYDTMDAILLTKNISYIDGVKLDVRMTKDNILVLSKYNDLSKLTMSKKKVSECDYQYLRKVKFPSHIFKYYIPTLKEILNRYNKDKIIVLEIFDEDNINYLCSNLYNLLSKYPYKYYFISENMNVQENLRKNNFEDLGIIVDNNEIKVLYNIPNDEDLLLSDNILLILDNPKKIINNIFFDKI